MSGTLLFFIFAAVILVFFINTRRKAVMKRTRFIDNYQFPDRIPQKVKEHYPHLTDEQVEQVIVGLRDYFHICHLAGRRMVSMPSQIVDVAWHEFILFTRKYDYFCQQSLGRFLHHTPAEAMKTPTRAQQGIKVAWRLACKREKIAPRSPHRLPLIFAIDKLLDIKDGFFYSLNCKAGKADNYCASSIGCSSCGGCGGDSSGCGGGCGGGD